MHTLSAIQQYDVHLRNKPSPLQGLEGPLLVLLLQSVLIPVVALWGKPLCFEDYLPKFNTFMIYLRSSKRLGNIYTDVVGKTDIITPSECCVVRLQAQQTASCEMAVLVIVDDCSPLQHKLVNIWL